MKTNLDIQYLFEVIHVESSKVQKSICKAFKMEDSERCLYRLVNVSKIQERKLVEDCSTLFNHIIHITLSHFGKQILHYKQTLTCTIVPP